MRLLHLIFAVFACWLVGAAYAQDSLVRQLYDKREVYITMRDGIRLFTSIYVPKDKSKKPPILMMRTPYSCRPYGADRYRGSLGPEPEFVREGYVFVYQDVRGRYMSEGDFAWMRPFRPDKPVGSSDETTDTYDTIEWLLKNISHHNGKVGVYGTSYPGHYAAQCLIDPHPALAAVSPQAPMADNWLGDDMHHNGAFFLPHAMNFIAGFGKKREGPTQDYGPRVFSHGTPDGYRFFLEMGALRNAQTKFNMDQIDIWKEWMQRGDYDHYWQAQNVPQHMGKVGDIPVLIVGGWWDAEDLYGPLAIFSAIQKRNVRNRTCIVMGPWYHGSWNGGPGDGLHDIVWTTKTGEDFRNTIQRPFFRYYLWGEDEEPLLPKAKMFDVGADTWRSFSEWPPNSRFVKFFLHARRPYNILSLLGQEPQAIVGYDQFENDPWRPVPASNTISTGMPRSYLIEDQRFVWSRPDVLSYETAPLEESITLAGPINVTLYVATTGTDADFIVKLIDVFPNNYQNNSPRGAAIPMGGYQMLVRGEPMRAKYRKSWSHPEPLIASNFSANPSSVNVEVLNFTMPDILHTFKKGHKLMVQVQSSWFPVVDRNPNKFCDIYSAKDEDFEKSTHRVYSGGHFSSNISVGVISK